MENVNKSKQFKTVYILFSSKALKIKFLNYFRIRNIPLNKKNGIQMIQKFKRQQLLLVLLLLWALIKIQIKISTKIFFLILFLRAIFRIWREMEPMIHELRAETYFGLIRLLKPGCRSIVILLDTDSKEVLLPQFARHIYSLRKSDILKV